MYMRIYQLTFPFAVTADDFVICLVNYHVNHFSGFYRQVFIPKLLYRQWGENSSLIKHFDFSIILQEKAMRVSVQCHTGSQNTVCLTLNFFLNSFSSFSNFFFFFGSISFVLLVELNIGILQWTKKKRWCQTWLLHLRGNRNAFK